MFDRLRERLDRIRAPELDWLQIEITTWCTARCSYCPHGALPGGLQKKHMPFDLFLRLVPFMDNVRMAYLQGWGEPLLHPDIFAMINCCREKAECVGFTTNGMLLNRNIIQRIIDSGVDILGVSLAGTTATTHNTFRQGNDFDTLIANLRHLNNTKRQQGAAHPDVHLAYLILKSNFRELEGLIPLARELGVTQIVASHPALLFDDQFYEEALFNNPELAGEYSLMAADIKEQARQHGICFRAGKPYLSQNPPGCSENVTAACVVNVDGEVSPCVFTNPVLEASGSARKSLYLFRRHEIPLRGISFGNIRDTNLTRIWLTRKYVDFRMCFDTEARVLSPDYLPPVPGQCAHCYKLLINGME